MHWPTNRIVPQTKLLTGFWATKHLLRADIMSRINIAPQSPAQGWNCYWVETYTDIVLVLFEVNDDNIKSRKKNTGDVQGHWKIWTQDPEPAVNLSPTCSTYTVEVILSTTPLYSLFFWTGFLEKKMTDDVLIHISLYAILRAVRVNLFLAPWCSLIWGIFFKLGVGGSLTQEDLLGDQSWHRHNFLSCHSQRTFKAQSNTPHPHPPINVSFFPHHNIQLTSFWLGTNPVTPCQQFQARSEPPLRYRRRAEENTKASDTKNNSIIKADLTSSHGNI